jgi:hypothetical protein
MAELEMIIIAAGVLNHTHAFIPAMAKVGE